MKCLNLSGGQKNNKFYKVWSSELLMVERDYAEHRRDSGKLVARRLNGFLMRGIDPEGIQLTCHGEILHVNGRIPPAVPIDRCGENEIKLYAD